MIAGVAYLAKSPWIRSGTVREVVVQELPFDEKMYWCPGCSSGPLNIGSFKYVKGEL